MDVYKKIRQETVAIELNPLKVFEVTGKDTIEYLHRMLTQDVRGMDSPEVRAACLCTHKGRLLANLLVVNWKDSTYLIVPEEQGETLFNQLEKYIIMDDVELTDVSEKWEFLSVQGPNAPGTFAEYCQSALLPGSRILQQQHFQSKRKTPSPSNIPERGSEVGLHGALRR